MSISRRDALLGATAAAVVTGTATVPLAIKAAGVKAALAGADEDPVLALKREWEARWERYGIDPGDDEDVVDRLLDALAETSFEIFQTPATTPAGIAVKLVIWARYHIHEGHNFDDDLSRFPVSDYTSLDLDHLPIISALHDLERLAGEVRS